MIELRQLTKRYGAGALVLATWVAVTLAASMLAITRRDV